MDDCYFCEVIAAKSYEIFFEHEHFVVLWDGSPSVPGHALITPKRHVQYVEQLTDSEACELIPLARQVINIIRSTDLEEVYVRMITLEHDKSRLEYYQNCLNKIRAQQATRSF